MSRVGLVAEDRRGLSSVGHSHIPSDTTHQGLRLLNPGSPTDRRRQPCATYLTARLAEGRIEDVTLHRR